MNEIISELLPGFWIYLALINIVAFVLFGLDKRRARRGAWRISEAALLGCALLGGAVGAWLGMKVFHHKNLHKRFRLGLPLLLILEAALVIWLLVRFVLPA